jgi:hypothetical protein
MFFSGVSFGEKPKLFDAESFRGCAGSDWNVNSADGLAYAYVSQMSGTIFLQSACTLCRIVGVTRNDVVAQIVLLTNKSAGLS